MTSVFISGGNGYIGKNLKASFPNNYQIFAPPRKVLELADSCAVSDYFKKNSSFDAVVNCAAAGVANSSNKTPEDIVFENLKSFGNLFQQRARYKRFIQIGSGAEYGKPFQKAYVTEEECGLAIPSDPYGMSKFYSGQALENQGEIGKVVNLRLFGIFGPYEDYRVRFISNNIVRSLIGLPIIVMQDAIFDYIYINDLIYILEKFIEKPAPYVSYNIASGQSYLLSELALLIKDIANNKYNVEIRNEDVKEQYTASNARLKAFLPADFKFTPIKIAIEKMVKWYADNLSTLSKEALKYMKAC